MNKVYPHIDDVTLAFHKYHGCVRRICRDYLRQPAKYAEEMSKVQQTLKEALSSMSLADKIDWTEKE